MAVDDLLRALRPQLHDGVYVYCALPAGGDLDAIDVIGMFREAEGVTVIMREDLAAARGLAPRYRAAWITLTVSSDLEDVGLTAAVARALADAGISCNVVAAVHHDHLFVPFEKGVAALDALCALQSRQADSR